MSHFLVLLVLLGGDIGSSGSTATAEESDNSAKNRIDQVGDICGKVRLESLAGDEGNVVRCRNSSTQDVNILQFSGDGQVRTFKLFHSRF